MEEADPLSVEIGAQHRHSSNIAARPVEARSITVLDQIEAIGRHYRNRGGGGLCCLHRAGPAGGNDYRRLMVDEIFGEHRQLPELQVRPAELDSNVLALDISGFFEALAELSHSTLRTL